MKNNVKISLALKFGFWFSVFFSGVIYFTNDYIQNATTERFTKQYQSRIDSSLQAIDQELAIRHSVMLNQLQQFSEKIRESVEFRVETAIKQNYHHPLVIQFASNFMSIMGFGALEVTNDKGMVISSGHRVSTIGADLSNLIGKLQASRDEPAFVNFERPGIDSLFCLAGLDSVTYSNQKYYIIGGFEISNDFMKGLQGDASQVVAILPPGTIHSSRPDENDSLIAANLHEIPSGEEVAIHLDDARYLGKNIRKSFYTTHTSLKIPIYLLHPQTELYRLLSEIDTFFTRIYAGTFVITIFISFLLTTLVTRRLKRLSNTAESLSLDTLDVEFNAGGVDEVGVLSNKLQEMVKRLRQNLVELSVAEQKAAFADIARQVNHDIKNGFIPIRHVMKHWEEVAEENPEELLRYFKERKATVIESLNYLENLARNYSRVRPTINLTNVNVNHLIRALLKNYQFSYNGKVKYRIKLDSGNPFVEADITQLRRAFENILRNAIEALNGGGNIAVSTRISDGQVVTIWKDDGSGISEAILQQLFTTPITTKEQGTGIGLANVKRIIESFNGRVTIESVVNKGTTVTITLPRHKTAKGIPVKSVS